LTYDVSEGGADFIITLGKRRIVMEIGAGKKGYRQAIATAQKIKPEYSIIVSNDELEYSKNIFLQRRRSDFHIWRPERARMYSKIIREVCLKIWRECI